MFTRCRTCEGRCGENGRLCLLICRESGCECPFRDGYVRDSSANCIPSGDCPAIPTATGTTRQTTTQTMPSRSSSFFHLVFYINNNSGDRRNAESDVPNTKQALITENLSMHIQSLICNMPLTSCSSHFTFHNSYVPLRGKCRGERPGCDSSFAHRTH